MEQNYIENPIEITKDIVKSLMPERSPTANKGTFGHLLSICGSMTMPGSAVLAAKAAVRMGVGLVTAVFPVDAYSAIASKLTEPLLLPVHSDENGFATSASVFGLAEKLKVTSSCLIGCGLGITSETKKLVKEIILKCRSPLIIDADGINSIMDNINILNAVTVPKIITPHPGEMSRICGINIYRIQQDRTGVASWFSKQFNTVVVLKGSGTIIALPDGTCYINPTGNSGMAKGGSGDMLAGMIASLCAQGIPVDRACICGVYLHGAAGDLAASMTCKRAITPSDMIEVLPTLLSEYE